MITCIHVENNVINIENLIYSSDFVAVQLFDKYIILKESDNMYTKEEIKIIDLEELDDYTTKYNHPLLLNYCMILDIEKLISYVIFKNRDSLSG